MALFFLIAGSIDSIRNLPATALFGTSLFFFLILASLIFLVPVALTSAQLGGYKTKEPGIYGWVKEAFGDKAGFLAVWLQWINTLVWFPTMLSFIAGTLAYLINPNLVQHKSYLVAVILVTFWLLTLANLRGIHFSTKLASVSAIVGLVIPIILVISLALLWVVQGRALQLHFTSGDMLPALGHSQNWVSLTAIMTAFLGIELASVHAKQVKNPQKAFPKALIVAVVFILITMLGGSLAIALVLPKTNINLVSGIMQVFQSFFAAYHLSWLTPVLAVMIVGMAPGLRDIGRLILGV